MAVGGGVGVGGDHMQALAEERDLLHRRQALDHAHGVVGAGTVDLEHGLGHVAGLELARGAQRDELAAVDDAQPVAVFGLLHVVRGYEDRDALSGQRRR